MRRKPVHPHVRGEHISCIALNTSACGSSPRAWGTRSPRRCCARTRRFIPTCVGNTTARTSPTRSGTVHPHVRGEHWPSTSRTRAISGSSPRAWGTLCSQVVIAVCERFIPTCVGNTRPRRRRTSGPTVHPHVRGEHLAYGVVDACEPGSSPRAWGTLDAEQFPECGVRFIPTCVGNTAMKGYEEAAHSVHPHVRGEHCPACAIAAHKPGSSPRAWGTLQRGNARRHHGRFIPTCVGNTA